MLLAFSEPWSLDHIRLPHLLPSFFSQTYTFLLHHSDCAAFEGVLPAFSEEGNKSMTLAQNNGSGCQEWDRFMMEVDHFQPWITFHMKTDQWLMAILQFSFTLKEWQCRTNLNIAVWQRFFTSQFTAGVRKTTSFSRKMRLSFLSASV